MSAFMRLIKEINDAGLVVNNLYQGREIRWDGDENPSVRWHASLRGETKGFPRGSHTKPLVALRKAFDEAEKALASGVEENYDDLI